MQRASWRDLGVILAPFFTNYNNTMSPRSIEIEAAYASISLICKRMVGAMRQIQGGITAYHDLATVVNVPLWAPPYDPPFGIKNNGYMQK